MKTLTFAKRNFKELIRDPISLAFCIGLPLFLLVIFQQFKIPSEVYSIKNFAPSIVVFSFGFIALFSGLLIAKDRTTSFLSRLFASPLTAGNYLVGYSISLIPIAILQSVLFFIVSLFLGLEFSINILITILICIPLSFLFIGLGILVGCGFNDKQAPGVASIIVQLIAFTSGMWFDVDTMNSGFKTVCNVLPFRYAVDLARYGINGEFDKMLIPFIIILAYVFLAYTIATIVFRNKMTN